ncbi:aspartate-semialdehyde dehydrogenase [Paraburkholderia sp. Ac-20336]|uniref:aspartate-semialdehyde dehydrogenase n=1 Tax=Paraburkholderia sp. Ac-20336 TaxID=2703886 RepID=UPI001F11CD40|nr:aspartate-semialdehyde dehydrogenase [Paraburkholderia sp. Ac-20336]
MSIYPDAGILADTLMKQCGASDYAGYDPFDGLNSALFRRLRLSSVPFAQIAWLQFHKRSRFNFRPLVGVPPLRNPKGIALIILGLLERERRVHDDWNVAEAMRLAEWLMEQRSERKTWKHNAWGYHFDWAARAFFVPRGTPNAITTCYVARALAALGQHTGDTRFVDAATDAGLFLDSLYRNDGDYYAYIPGESAFVHNANLWTAATVGEAASRLGSEALMRRALKAARRSGDLQREDGAWRYGTRDHHGFVDGFHTGYNLEALTVLQRAACTDEFAGRIELGMNYYRTTFILPDGTVKYYDDNVWPLDTHSVAQALITLINVGASKADHDLASRIYKRAIETLYLPRHQRFMYQRGRFSANKVNYIRWTQAWAFYALGMLSNLTKKTDATLEMAVSPGEDNESY